MRDRRQFLKSSAILSLCPTVPAFLARTASANDEADNGRILVVIQLDGGNDGINTVVPHADDSYEKHRKSLRLPRRELIKLSDEFAFHPRMRRASELFDDGRLSVVHAVGYPNPNRSHFESMHIWHAASDDPERLQLGNGWLGEVMSLRGRSKGPHAIHVGDGDLPLALRGRRCTATSLASMDDLRLSLPELASQRRQPENEGALADFVTRSMVNAFTTAKELSDVTKQDPGARYPTSKLGQRLRAISRLIKSDAPARVYYTLQTGYDTHANQLPAHAGLLDELSSSLKAFMDDLQKSQLADRVLVVAFSEFGRRVKENASLGTDHGTAGPLLMAGTKLKQRSYGQLPSLTDLDAGDLKHHTDFRHVYASVVTDWLGLRLPESLRDFRQGESYFQA